MTKNQDARPFVDLKKDAEEFREKFDEDIQECMDLLDKKITSLICDPDTLGNLTKSISTNALVEFSKAKYDIFMSVKSLINAKEREWITYISEMKKLFIENVEIFLAGTKLEVKLPSSEYQSSVGSRKSPGNRKSISSSVTSTILNTITKNIPGIGSPLYKEESSRNISEISNVEDKIQFNRRGRLSASSAKLYDGSAFRSVFDEMDFDVDDHELNLSHSRRSSSVKSRKSSNSDLNTSLTGRGRRSSLKKDLNADLPVRNVSASENHLDSTESESEFKKPRPVLKPKKAGAKTATNKVSTSDENEENNLVEVNNQMPVKGRRGRTTAKNKNDSIVNDTKSNATENGDQNGQAEEIPAQVPVRGRRGRTAKGANIDDSKASNVKTSSSDENENIKSEATKNKLPTKAPRGRAAAKNKADSSAVTEVPTSSSDEKEMNGEVEESTNHVSLKRGKGKVTGKNKAIDSEMKEPEEPETNKTRRGRQTAAAAAKSNKSVPVQSTSRSRRAAKAEEIPQPGPSRSPQKESVSAEDSDIELPTPVSRPTKSTIRRKTLLPNLVEFSDQEIIPGNPTRTTKAKRKTIASISDVDDAMPTKRLKVSSKKSSQVQEADETADDNLLDTDDNYSEWMTLKAVDGKVPPRPGIYEMKVWRAKKPAYIGDCESLRQKLTLHKMKQNSGHKHLNKFVERNFDEIQVRYEAMSSVNEAKTEAKNRIKQFVSQYKTTPAYN